MAYGCYGDLSVNKPRHQKQHCSVVKRKSTNVVLPLPLYKQGQCTRSIQWVPLGI